MDEEGTVVYYRTSPALKELASHYQSLSDELAFTEPLNDDDEEKKLQEEKKGEEEISPHSLGNNMRTHRDRREERWPLCYLTRYLIFSPDNQSDWANRHCRDVAMTIRDSPLLTEDDYQLLHFALLKPHPLLNITSSTSKQPSSKFTRIDVWMMLVVIVLAVGWMSHMTLSLSLILLMMVVVALLLLSSGVVVEHLVSKRKKRVLLEASQTVSDYCREIESLLSLLSHTLRTIRETELVNRQFTRNIRVSVEDNGGSTHCHTHYQCLGLRWSLFLVCQTVVRRLRSATLHISQIHPLTKEMECSSTSYLANSPLSSLHSHLSTNLDEISKEKQSKENECLSQESLKDAANLLAVQSSELLRHVALSLISPPPPPPPTPGVGDSSRLRSFAEVLHSLIHQILECRLRLEWNCDLHRNHLLDGECPGRSCDSERPSTKEGEVSPPPPPPPGGGVAVVTQLERDVHCIDVQTQTALQRIRDLGDVLKSDNDRSILLQDSRGQLNVIQRMIDSVCDKLDDSITFIDHHLSPSTSQNAGEEKEGGSEEAAAANITSGVISAETLENVPGSYSNSDDDDDEKVFEGYVCGEEEEEEEGSLKRGGREEEEDAVGRKEREVGVRMMRELEGILAVRSEKRAREREERRRRRKPREEHEKEIRTEPPKLPEMDTSLGVSSNVFTIEEKEKDSLHKKEKEKEKEGVEKEEAEKGDEEEKEEEEDETPNELRSKSDLPSLLNHHQLALRVAALATSRHGNRVEETFGSDIDESSDLET